MKTEYLFSYGTLQLESVQIANFDRLLAGRPDELPGFEALEYTVEDAQTISLSGKAVQKLARFTGCASDSISGTVYEVTIEEVNRADEYEVLPWVRASVVLKSGIRAWVYVDGRNPNKC